MGKASAIARRSATTGQFVLNRSLAEKISAVEGMTLSARMATILDEASRQGLKGDALRARIKAETHKK